MAMSFSFAPERKDRHRLYSSRSVMNSLNRETTMAKRLPLAFKRAFERQLEFAIFSVVSFDVRAEIAFFLQLAGASRGENIFHPEIP